MAGVRERAKKGKKGGKESKFLRVDQKLRTPEKQLQWDGWQVEWGGDRGESTGQIAAGGDGCKAESSSGRKPGESQMSGRGPGGNQLDDWLETPLVQGRIRTPASVQNSDTRHLFPGVGQWCRSKDKKGYRSSVSDSTCKEAGGLEPGNYHPASALCRTVPILNTSLELTMCLSAVEAHYVSSSPTGRGVHQGCIFSPC